MTEYRPGVCNIGRDERRKRYAVGAVGFAAAAAVVAAADALALPGWTLLAAALPLFAGFLGVYQARLGFCVGYAARGVYDDDGDRAAVPDADARRADARRARRVNVYAAASAVLAAAVVYLAFA